MEKINFNGKKFPIVNIDLPFGERKISSQKLNEALMNLDGSYISEEARMIDENIFYYVEEKVIHSGENEIINKVISEI